MATVDQNPVNNVAVNDAGAIQWFGSSAVVAAALISATPTYYWMEEKNLQANASISSYIRQTHQVFANPLGTATGEQTGLAVVTKPVTANLQGDAEIQAKALGGFGGAEFEANATVTEPTELNYVWRVTSLSDATATLADDDSKIWFTHYATAVAGINTAEEPSYFIADPSILLNGATDYVHYVGTDRRYSAYAEISYLEGGIKIYSDAWLPFGGATFEISDDNYVWKAEAVVNAAGALWADPIDNFFGTANATPTATMVLSEQKYAIATASMDAPSEFITPYARAYYAGVADLASTSSAVFSVSYQTHFGGYPDITGTATQEHNEVVTRYVGAKPKGVGTIQPSAFTYHLHQANVNLQPTSNFNAVAAVWGYDVYVFERQAEFKDFERPAEFKDFVRNKT